MKTVYCVCKFSRLWFDIELIGRCGQVPWLPARVLQPQKWGDKKGIIPGGGGGKGEGGGGREALNLLIKQNTFFCQSGRGADSYIWQNLPICRFEGSLLPRGEYCRDAELLPTSEQCRGAHW